MNPPNASGGRPAAGRAPSAPPRRGPGGAVGILHIISGNDRGKQFPLANASTSIGRGADQDFVLADIAASRKHAIITVEGERYRLTDLGSGNGTLVNGARSPSALLVDGDQIEIGNTLLRLEHAPSAMAQAAPPAAAPISPPATSEARTMIAEAPVLPAMQPQPHAPQPVYAPPAQAPAHADNFHPHTAENPAARRSGPSHGQGRGAAQASLPPVAGGHTGGFLASPGRKLAVFGGLGLMVVLGGGLVVRKAMGPGNNTAEAQRLYVEGTTAFRAGEYEHAKQLFGEALKAAPESPQAAKYLGLCDVEIHAKSAIKMGKNLIAAKQYDEAFKALDTIDKSATSFDESERIRKAAIPGAVQSALDEARDLMKDDADGAKAKVVGALALDPDSTEARDLLAKIKGEKPAVVEAAAAPEPAAHEGKARHGKKEAHAAAGAPSAAAPAPKVKEAPAAKVAAAPVKTKEAPPETSGGGGGSADLMANKAAAAAYKAKDFAGAAQALRMQAKTEKMAVSQKLIVTAAQVAKLGDSLNRAEGAKSSNPAGAVADYQTAVGIDASVGHGFHGAFLKGAAGKTAKQAAQTAFGKQLYDSAYEMAKAAQKLGGDDGGVMAQLQKKAADLVTRAQGMARTNPSGAKAVFQTVTRMVPPGDPSYVKAQQGMASTKAPKDEDED